MAKPKTQEKRVPNSKKKGQSANTSLLKPKPKKGPVKSKMSGDDMRYDAGKRKAGR